jgi:branched-chain amino acid transport system substrate-binding protein
MVGLWIPASLCSEILTRRDIQFGRGRLWGCWVLLAVTTGLTWLAKPSSANAQFLTRDRPLAQDEIRIGMSNSQSGSFGQVGVAVKEGTEAYFARINRQGGVHGRKLKLVAYDDEYEPMNTIVNTERLVNRDRVFALLGYVGSACCHAALPMLREADIALVGALTSATLSHDPQDLLFVTRPSFPQEAETVISHLTADLGVSRIALFRQEDDYGDAGRAAVVEALQRRDLQIAGEGSYIRNSIEIQTAVDQIVSAQPEAVLLIGTYKPCAALVKGIRQRGLSNVIAVSLSPLGTESLVKLLGPDAEGLVIPEFVPWPEDRSLTLVQNYQDDVRRLGSEHFSYAGLEAYLNAWVLVSALTQAGHEMTRQSFIDALRSTSLEFDALQVSFPIFEQGDQGKTESRPDGSPAASAPSPGQAVDRPTAEGKSNAISLVQVLGGQIRRVEALSRPGVAYKP